MTLYAIYTYMYEHTHKGCEVICFLPVQIVVIFCLPCQAWFCRKWAWEIVLAGKRERMRTKLLVHKTRKVLKALPISHTHVCL